MVEQILSDATHSVAAHLTFRPVGVEHSHPRIGLIGWHDQDHAVAADAGVAVADGTCERERVVRRALVERADIHVIVADSVHLGEPHRSFYFLSRGGQRWWPVIVVLIR